ncbi:Protein of unknown function [Salinihabitans flavidus]|uniref:DUF3108 domain-containing protein n=1 Tax=Salinihabitans flavidus TaxID=569882 RepID=A0A1H8LFJ6_9RHOB|nr:DUF3108 domain-containing protein [Salinihabitans flavidus]SEO03924.1 Protein of unknown function [Salinihabitans flavidus]
MPCPRLACPARAARWHAFLLAAMLGCLALPAQAGEQAWSVHAFGIKVGEMRLKVSEADARYTGAAAFRTTGLAGVLRRIRFSITSHGRLVSGRYQPDGYDGQIDTGKRVSETRLDFAGTVPRKVSGAQDPAVPIPDAAKRGAHDPMTVMWQVLRDQSDETLCAFDQTQFDGTRLTRITLSARKQVDEGTVTCNGRYDRIGGYSDEELAEMATSPLSVTYRAVGAEGARWRAEGLSIVTRHGTATLHRRD